MGTDRNCHHGIWLSGRTLRYFSKNCGVIAGPETAFVGDQIFGNVAGLSLIIAGAALIFIAMLHFQKNARSIDSSEQWPSPGTRLDLTLAAMLVVLGIALVIYLTHALS